MATDTHAAASNAVRSSALFHEKALIGGQWRAAASGRSIAVDDPFTGETIAAVPELDRQEVQGAIDAAETAFRDWSRRPARERGALLRRWYELIVANREGLARLITLENGKPLKESRAEIDYGAGFVEFYADEAARALGEVIPANVPGRELRATREPIGVCVAIHAVELPQCHADSQARAGAGGGLHDGRQACLADAALGHCARRAGTGGGHPRGRAQCRDRQGLDGRRARHLLAGRAQDQLHRVNQHRRLG